MKAIICVGISGSGKTTWAEEYVRNRADWIVVCRDDIRFNGGSKIWNNWTFNKKNEDEVTRKYWELIEYAALQGMNVILADTNLNIGRRIDMANKLIEMGYEVEEKHFDVDLRDAISRDNQRFGGVGSDVILRQWCQYKGDEYGKYVAGDGEKVYVVDIDGTVAESQGRGWYDWERVGEDLPKTWVMDIVKGLNAQGYGIVFLSGRDGSCYDITKQWLYDHFGSDFELFMREAGDMRRDSIIKRELFDTHIRNVYNVQAVIDDRQQVLHETWGPLGVNVLCVGLPALNNF